MTNHLYLNTTAQRGSILLYVLLGIVLLGALTLALRNTGGSGIQNIDREDMILKSNQIQKTGSDIAIAVNNMLLDGFSEIHPRFAHPDTSTDYGDITTQTKQQIFGKEGRKVNYPAVPAGINDGSKWEFVATSRIPQVGSDRAELTAVLPNVTKEFCEVINNQLGFTPATQPTDKATGTSPDCVTGASSDRFTGTFNDLSPNIMDDTTFSRLPALQACVYCASNSSYNYYYVLIAR